MTAQCLLVFLIWRFIGFFKKFELEKNMSVKFEVLDVLFG